jgi:glycosyltransferase involved in cell wall biosynthesis
MKTQKIIGVDARFYGEAGPGRYAKAIVEHLEKIDKKNKYLIFLRKKGFDSYRPKNSNFVKVLADYPWYSWDEQIRFLFVLIKSKLDLLYVPHFNVPIFYPGKLVTAIPDLIMHTYSTEEGTTLFKPYFKFKKLIYWWVVYLAIKRSEKVIVPSNSVIEEDFLKVYPQFPREKYVLAYEGVDPDFLKCDLNPKNVIEKFGIKKPFLLFIGSMSEHKNVKRLVEAFEILVEKYDFKGQLVLVGRRHKYSEETERFVKEKGLGEKVLMPGMKHYVSDEEVTALRKSALAYVFPSLKEGFSLTPLESQALGLPCVISDIPTHREIYGDSVLYFDPKSVIDMAEKMKEVVSREKLREELVEKGFSQVKKYSWDETAKITLGVFENILNQ